MDEFESRRFPSERNTLKAKLVLPKILLDVTRVGPIAFANDRVSALIFFAFQRIGDVQHFFRRHVLEHFTTFQHVEMVTTLLEGDETRHFREHVAIHSPQFPVRQRSNRRQTRLIVEQSQFPE